MHTFEGLPLAGPDDSRSASFFLLTPPGELEPWVGLPGGRTVGNDQTAAQASGKSLRSGAKRAATRSKPAKYGVHLFVEQVPKWHDLLDSLSSEDGATDDHSSTDAEIENVRGSVWLMRYLLHAWQMDLDARAAVRFYLLWG